MTNNIEHGSSLKADIIKSVANEYRDETGRCIIQDVQFGRTSIPIVAIIVREDSHDGIDWTKQLP